MPLTARRGEEYRFFPADDPPDVNVSGDWGVAFTDDEGNTSEAIGEFVQDGTKLHGTFRTPTGDYRFLAGEVHGQTMYLSCFDGGHAFLFKAVLYDEDTLEGDFWSGTAWHERWTGLRNEYIDLPDPNQLTYLKDGYDRFDFTFPDLNGRDVSLSDDVFRGKVVIVAVAGSWCPNCHDEAAFLSEYYRENRERGVEVVSLMYEHFKDFERAARQIERFRSRYDITYRTLFAGYSDKKAAAETLPMLNHVLAYPTTIFIDREGEVRRIHTGFDGPGTGEHFEKFKADFTAYVDELLAE
jgi:peroxiredoxin